jgi:Putative metal-binding motif
MYLVRLLFPLHLLLVACAEPEDKAPALAVDPLSMDFGAVEVGAEGVLPLTLTNSGGGSIAILSVSVTEGSDIWSVERAEEDAISAGASVAVDVIMAPEEEGDFTGTLLVRTDLDEEGTIEVALLGSGAPSTVDTDGDGYSPASGDCDEANAAVNPGAEELCDGVDNNCDGSVPADEVDSDRDGHYLCGGDCDDADANVYPEAPEICDEKDSDCDGVSADNDDLDEDGYSVCDGDCEDQEPLVSPVLVEECDDLDNDCSGVVDDVDADADGHSLCSPGGDCDDHDPSAHPVVVDASYTGAGLGTDEEPYTTWSDAVANVDEICRTIVLLPGTYAVGWTAEDQMLTVLGGGEGPEEVILTPVDTTSRHFDLSGGAVLELVNLTLSAGAGSGDGGAIRAIGSEVVLDGVIASGNHCTGDGGAVGITSGTLSLTGGTQFDGNLADDDGGAVAVVSGQLIDIGGSRWQNNAGVRGGALMLDTSSATIAGATFQVNSASDSGGAIMVVGGNSISIRRSQIWLNEASLDGGGVAIIDLNDPTSALTNLILQDN